MKFEMDFGWTGNEKIVVETFDFEKIQIIQAFIQFQEEHGWEVEYEAIEPLDEDFEEDTEEEEVPPFALSTHEPL
jgi:tyrosyl-tRNA synthetase